MEKQSILLVDDHPENLLVLERSLEDLDLHLVKATSGNEALSLMLETDFALVLLDVQMPEMDGYEAASLMRQLDQTKNVPIIFVTAINTADQQVFKGYESGAVDYLFKPIVPEILCSKVKVFADLHRQRVLIQEQMDEIMTLRGIIPVCATCKRIKNDAGDWESLESYILEHSEAQFSHGICSECLIEQYPDMEEELARDQGAS